MFLACSKWENPILIFACFTTVDSLIPLPGYWGVVRLGVVSTHWARLVLVSFRTCRGYNNTLSVECSHLELFLVGLLHWNPGWKIKQVQYGKNEEHEQKTKQCEMSPMTREKSGIMKIKGVSSVCFYVWHTLTTLKNCSSFRKLKKTDLNVWTNLTKLVQCKGGQMCIQTQFMDQRQWTGTSSVTQKQEELPGCLHWTQVLRDTLCIMKHDDNMKVYFWPPSPANSFWVMTNSESFGHLWVPIHISAHPSFI